MRSKGSAAGGRGRRRGRGGRRGRLALGGGPGRGGGFGLLLRPDQLRDLPLLLGEGALLLLDGLRVLRHGVLLHGDLGLRLGLLALELGDLRVQ